MKKCIFCAVIALLLWSCSKSDKQSEASKSEQVQSEASGETTYYVGLIQQGSAWTAEITPELEELQKAHMANIQRLSDSGVLKLAGPMWVDSGNSFLRGLFFFETGNVQQARQLSATDPAVRARRLSVQVHPWIGSAGMIYDEPVEMTTYQAVIYYKGANWSAAVEPDFDSLLLWQSAELQKYDYEARSVIAGPFKRTIIAEAPSSMFIYATDSLSWLESVVFSSLPVRRGILDPVVLHWYGPVGLRE